MLWGRLSFDPTLPDALFVQTLAQRFPEVTADQLLAGWNAASNIFPELTRFFWGNIDLKWFPEACWSHPKYHGFYTVEDFINGEGMPNSGDLTIRQWRERLLAKEPMDGITPLEVAAALRRYAETAKHTVAELRPRQGANKELRLTLGDMEAFSCLGFYYAAKIEGAGELALFDADADARIRPPPSNISKQHSATGATTQRCTLSSTDSLCFTTMLASWTFPSWLRRWQQTSSLLATGSPETSGKRRLGR